MIFVIDFGGQTAHLISRRIKDLGIPAVMIHPEEVQDKIKKERPAGIILSGGPASVYEEGAPTIDEEIFTQGIPILGICYGMQLTSHLLGGDVISGRKEYGPATLRLKIKDERLKNEKIINHKSLIINHLSKQSTVWMSHGDEVKSVPKGFETIGSTETVPYAFVANFKTKNFGVQFHPEVEHTEEGIKILENFIRVCELKGTENKIDVGQIVNDIKQTVGNEYVIGAISGGVDSTVAGTLVADAIGDHFIPIYVENGLMREGTAGHVLKIFKKFGIEPIIVECQGEMLKRLKTITDSEEKRKIIGNFYIEIFDREVEKLKNSNRDIKFLLQGTIYSDVIESQGTKHSDKIKSHHNVGGLPIDMKLKLLEPLRHFYKDEVRAIGKSLGLPDEFIWKQPFPGPGYAIRIRGEVTEDRLFKQKAADKIILEELETAGLLRKVFISFPVMTGAESTAVKGDGRFFGEVIALRIIESNDVMTSTWARLPYDVLQRISSRIVNEVPHISRVVYDISTKPPATMEWE